MIIAFYFWFCLQAWWGPLCTHADWWFAPLECTQACTALLLHSHPKIKSTSLSPDGTKTVVPPRTRTLPLWWLTSSFRIVPRFHLQWLSLNNRSGSSARDCLMSWQNSMWFFLLEFRSFKVNFAATCFIARSPVTIRWHKKPQSRRLFLLSWSSISEIRAFASSVRDDGGLPLLSSSAFICPSLNRLCHSTTLPRLRAALPRLRAALPWLRAALPRLRRMPFLRNLTHFIDW